MWTLSIDIGGTFIKSALVKETAIEEKRQTPTPKADASEWIDFLITLIKSYDKKDVQRVGIAVPGAVKDNGLIQFGGAVAGLDQVNVKEEIEKRLPVTVFVENDAKAATLGETSFGNLKDYQNGAAVILGTGVGVGLLLDGSVRKGPHCQAGEVSFLIQDQAVSGLESFVGINLSAVRLVKELATVFECEADGPEVFRLLAQEENEQALQVFSNYCRRAALLCFNLQCLIDLEKLVIGGGISQQPLLIKEIKKYYDQIFQFSPMIDQTIPHIPIEAACFQSNANLIGAAKGAQLDETIR